MEMNIGANIKRLRNQKNITQEQLSTAMNVSCAAVSKWERGETYPDITLLQPLAYFFEVTLDDLMGYDQEKIKREINEVIDLYKKHWFSKKGREIIVKAYHDYPNDYNIMHYYMWNIGGDMADNDPAVLIAHKDEFLSICDKILDGCGDERIRLGAWNMLAQSFLGRIENDLYYRGGTDEQIIAVMDKNLYAKKMLHELREDNEALDHSFDRFPEDSRNNRFKFNLDYRANATKGRRAELLGNPEYVAVLNKYQE